MRLLAPLLVLLAVAPASAKTLYVNAATGNDATSYAANDVNNPWATICRALKGTTSCASSSAGIAAQQGDTVVVIAGVYSVAGSSSRLTPALYPINDGASGSLITIQASGGTVEVRLSSGTGPAIGCRSNSYVTWTRADSDSKWYVDEDQVPVIPDTGPVVLSSSDHCVMEWLEVNGTYVDYPGTGGDNHNGIRIEQCDDCEVRNALIYEIGSIEGTAPGTAARRQNDAGIMLYSSDRVLLEHNTIYDVGTGIYVKDLAADTGTMEDGVVRLNWIHDAVVHGIFYGKDEDGKAYQNLIEDSGECVHFRDLADSAGTEDDDMPVRTIVANNTCDNVTSGIVVSGASGLTVDVRVEGNIINAATTMWRSDDGDYSGPNDVTSNRNVYRGTYTNFGSFAGGTTYTLAAFRTAFSMDADSITTDPQLLGGANCRGFELHASSAARSLAVDIADIDGDANVAETKHAGACQDGTETFGVESAAFVPEAEGDPTAKKTRVRGRIR
jgi:hypothetical protein